jgi:hypothetical protein
MDYLVEVSQIDESGKRIKTIDSTFTDTWEKAIDEATELLFVNFKSDLPNDITEPVTPKLNYKNLLIEIIEAKFKSEEIRDDDTFTVTMGQWELGKVYVFFKA